MPHVRRIRHSDVSTLRDIRLAALSSDPHAFSTTWQEEEGLTDEAWQDRADRAVSGDDAATFLSFAGASATGLVTMLRRPGSPASSELVSMWTDQKHRSSGTGTALIEAGIEWAAAAGYEAVQLWVMSENLSARQFYQRRGFVEIDPEEVDATDPCRDQIRMERRL